MSDRGVCEFCQHETEVKFYERGFKFPPESKAGLCELCANTNAATRFLNGYRSEPSDDAVKVICFVGNKILDAVLGKHAIKKHQGEQTNDDLPTL